MDSLEIGSGKEGALCRLRLGDESMRLPAALLRSNVLGSDTSGECLRGATAAQRERTVCGEIRRQTQGRCSSYNTLASPWEWFLRSLEEQTLTASFPHPGSSQAPRHCLPSLIRISSDGEQGKRLSPSRRAIFSALLLTPMTT